MDTISRFTRSYTVLGKFHQDWLSSITRQCKQPDQRQAAYCVWTRYSMSMRTISALLDPHLFPDLSVIVRGCLEFDVTLEAIIKDKDTAHDYLEFDKHAKAHYLRILSRQVDIDRLHMRGEQFKEWFGAHPENFKRTKWYGKGMTGLMQELGRTQDERMYNMLSHFAHGSVSASQFLEKASGNSEELFAAIVDSAYTAYLDSSYKFLCYIWKPLVTAEGGHCKSKFEEVMHAYVA